MNLEKARFNMIEQQIRPWQVNDERVLAAMATTPRELFVDDAWKSLAYADVSVNLGNNQSMLPPKELARMLQALQLKGSEKTLEIGTGSGYSAVLLSKLCKEVHSVDIIAEFVDAARGRINQLGIKNCELAEADAADGYAVAAPFDAILITAAQPELGDGIRRILNSGGRVVSILEHLGKPHVAHSTLNAEGEWQHDWLFPVEARPLINAVQKSQFVF